MATDAELNQYLSVKRYAPYRKEARWDHTRNDRLKELRQKITERSGQTDEHAESRNKKNRKRRGKKERQAHKRNAEGPEVSVGTDEPLNLKRKNGVDQDTEANPRNKKRRRRRDTEKSESPS